MPASTTRFRVLMTAVAMLGAIACSENDEPSTGSGGASNTGGASSSGGASTTGGATGTGGTAVDYCTQPSDCGWGEIDHEILAPTDCICLLGCPHLPLSKQTITRRQHQYEALCDPMVDGNGEPCPIDECAMPPEPTCQDDTCGPIDPWG
ncbi:MAG: hypothetical protein JW751_06835 [Polyangiaceae bacterium]|nr:hypothetical protein [Polyangiaceae bacterium]